MAKKPDPAPKISKRMNRQSRWWKCEGRELAKVVSDTVGSLKKNDNFRRMRYQECLTQYEGRPVSLDDDGYYIGTLQAAMAGQPMYNLPRSACDSVKADIAGRQKPKPAFITTGGDWRARRKARKCDKFVEGQMCQRQGRYANTWQLMEDVFHDSAKLGVGIAKVTPDVERCKVQIERVFPWQVFVDRQEARYGSPQNIFHEYPMEVDIAIDTFVEMNDSDEPKDDEERAKLNALESSQQPQYETGRVVESVMIREAWRLPFSESKPGRHVITCENAVLYDEEWTQDEFPFLILWWERETVGFWGQGIIEAHRALNMKTNRAAERIDESIAICSTKRVYIEQNMVKQGDMTAGGGPELIITVQDITRVPIDPPLSPVPPIALQWVQINRDRYYQDSGVSQMSATAQKSPGVTAAVAIEAENDLGAQRFMPKARAYEEVFVTAGKLFIEAAKRVAEHNGGKYLVRWPGERFIKEFDISDVSLEKEMYEIRVASVSMFAKDPAQMLQVAQDLHGAGIINRETFLQMTALPDLEGLMNRETAEREWLEELFDRFLDAEDDDNLLDLGGYEAPEPFIANKPAAMWLAVSTYWQAKRDSAPLFNLELVQRWIAQLDKLIAPPPPAADAATGLPTPEAPGALPMAGGGPEAPGMLPPTALIPAAA